MSYPASPYDAGTPRVRPDAAKMWAGGVATAVVAALIALVGILVSRWTLNIPILAPAGDGAWGDAHTGEYVLGAACVALLATALLHLLMLGAPRPRLFFGWIMGLATLAGVAYPFSTSAPLEQKAATAIVNLVLGVAIISLLNAVVARAVRIDPPAQPYRPGYPSSSPGQGYPPNSPGQGYPPNSSRPGYPSSSPGQGYPPTEPNDVPPSRTSGDWE